MNNSFLYAHGTLLKCILSYMERMGKRIPASVWTDGSSGCAPDNKLTLQGNSTPIENTTYTTGTNDT